MGLEGVSQRTGTYTGVTTLRGVEMTLPALPEEIPNFLSLNLRQHFVKFHIKSECKTAAAEFEMSAMCTGKETKTPQVKHQQGHLQVFAQCLRWVQDASRHLVEERQNSDWEVKNLNNVS